MKKTLLLFMVSFIAMTAHCQHYLGASLAGDIPFLTDRNNLTRTLFGGGGEVGMTYQFRHRRFAVQTGLGFSLQFPRLGLDNTTLEMPMVDTRGVEFLYKGDLADRTDQLNQHLFTVPLLLGYAGNHAYALAGVRLCLNMAATSTMQASLRTVGDYYDRYYEVFHDMPNHGYHDYLPVSSRGKVSLNHDLQLYAEAGYLLSLRARHYNPRARQQGTVLQLGLFVAYGLNDLQDGKITQALVEPDYSQYMAVEMKHVYTTTEAKDAKVHMLEVGLKVSLLFGFGPARRNDKCHCAR